MSVVCVNVANCLATTQEIRVNVMNKDQHWVFDPSQKHYIVAKQLMTTGTIASNRHTGKDYWKNQQLNLANKTYAKLMNGKKYEDHPRARNRSE